MSSLGGLDALLSSEGWPYASSLPRDAHDLGRYHALFGRDSAITSLQVLPAAPEVARATLRALAALQGTREDVVTDEEPGKIVHEYRRELTEHLRALGWGALFRDGELRYYGSADATSWFLVLLDALGDSALSSELEGSWRAAGRWLERTLERGAGLVRYGPRQAPLGLAQQGWRDAVDPADEAHHGGGILRDDGSVPRPPLADADCQAVALAALRALERLSGEQRWERAAAALAARVEQAFSPDTLALEADDRPVSGAGSQLGWLLWAGALGPAAAEAAAERLSRPDVLTGFGLRTLSSEHGAFDPSSYHRGSVWPFDCWIGWGGLRAAGHDEAAERVRAGVLEAIARLGDAPELYAVGAGGPEPIAVANRVQAWTVGARYALESGWDGRRVA